MQKAADDRPSATALADLGAIRAHGADAVRFLQGQLSNDVSKLAELGSMLAGFHNPQGRVIALLRLVSLAPEQILAILPRELAATTAARLAKFILRAKVKIQDESDQWRVVGVTALRKDEVAPSRVVPADPYSRRRWLVDRVEAPSRLEGYSSLDREGWRALDIATGLPQVYASTSEEFVAQMLNLDVLGAISFDKGCYTGQEVIARAHYRGRVKRRLQRFRTQGAPPVESAELKIVERVVLEGGDFEFLAVAPLGADGSLPLPYTLPE
jgi:folate-binding protein YgfZ